MGFLDDAEVNVNEIPDDPFGFGNQHWSVRIVELGEPKVTESGIRFGMMVKWAVDAPEFQGHYVSEGLGNGNWLQLPPPKALQSEMGWNPKSDEGKKVLFNLKALYTALGIPADQWGSVGPNELLHKGCLAKIKPIMENGYWKFNLYQQKPFPKDGSGSGLGEFSAASTSNPGTGGKTPEQLLEEELNNG